MNDTAQSCRPRIVGPGSLNVDITGYAPHLPVAGETTHGTTIRFSPGGKGNNQMTAAHRAGAEVTLIGCRGGDVLGQVLTAQYAAEGMSEQYIRIDPAGETGSAIIEIDVTDGQNRIMVIPAANATVDAARVNEAEAAIAAADMVLTQFETTVEAVETAKALAHKHGKPFMLNPAPYIKVSPTVFDGVDYVTPNETEAAAFTGVPVDSLEDCRRAAAVFLSWGVKHVIITLGVRGVFYTDGARELTVPALRVKAVNTTGAGDAFNGALATALAEGLPIETSLKFATCTSAISVTREGAAASMPHRDEITALMKKEFGVEMA